MTRNQMALRALVTTINREKGPTPSHLEQAVLLLINEVLALSRELDRVSSTASRAEHQSRRMLPYVR